jgi:hypothetical protein
MGDSMAQVGTTAASVLALALSLLNLYLQRRDRRPRLRIRVRYEYRVDTPDEDTGEDPAAAPRIHDDSQEGLYLRLGDFLREYGLGYPQGYPVVRFAVSNEGERALYLESVRLVLRPKPRLSGDRLVLDPAEDKVIPYELARGTANVLGQHGDEGLPVELVPGDGVGYRFELVRLANVLRREGHRGNVQLMLEATDRLGNAYRRPFSVNIDLWAHPKDEEAEED